MGFILHKYLSDSKLKSDIISPTESKPQQTIIKSRVSQMAEYVNDSGLFYCSFTALKQHKHLSKLFK